MKGKLESAAAGGGGRFEDAIAIVGYGGVFPGARNVEDFWNLIKSGVDVSQPVPTGRWTLASSQVLDPTVGSVDHVYTDRGCFIEGFRLNPSGLDLPAELLSTLDVSVQLLLEAGRNAIAGTRNNSGDRKRIGVVIGNIALPTTASSALCHEILKPLLDGNCATDPVGRPDLGTSALNRFVAGLPAGVLARALGLGGGSCTLDAACASSLYALRLACDELLAGRADAMLAGGVSRPDSLYTQMGFCQLRALAQTGRCAPFDKSASGLIVGEGAGVFVLKRVEDALSAGDTIHALVRGIGLSNDLEGNLLSPSSEGQLRALKAAYRQAGWSPEQVDTIECHATGTPVGDAIEFESLSKLWHNHAWRPGQCVLGAVKANIGHLLTAAGSAALIKILLALKHNTLPPTANFHQPGEKIPLNGSPFQILQETQPWARRDAATPRRAAINGFGFGGINAHALIEEWMGKPIVARASTAARGSSAKASKKGRRQDRTEIAIVGMAARVGPWGTLEEFQARVLGGGDEILPVARAAWRGVPSEEAGADFPGFYRNDLEIPVSRYKIPPKELAELLPQQALMLETAREALADVGHALSDPSHTGVFIGLTLDLRTTDFHSRWANLSNAMSGEAGLPGLTADRTLGALAGVNASRIAKEFRFGGPSFTVSNEDCSGLRALEIAVRALQKGEISQAVTGAVDLTGDLRGLLATDSVRPYSRNGAPRPFDVTADGPVPGEGAVALVLKRLEDARREGDRIYAIIRGVGSATGGEIGGGFSSKAYRSALEDAYAEAQVDPASVGYVELNGSARLEEDEAEVKSISAFFCAPARKLSCFVGSVTADVGHTGAAAGLVSLVKACLALRQEIIPSLRGVAQPITSLMTTAGPRAPRSPQYWVRDRADGPRRAGVSCASVDGNVMHVVLEACEEPVNSVRVVERGRPLGWRAEGLFALKAANPAGLLSRLADLRELVETANARPIESLAQQWWRETSHESGTATLALLAQDCPQLLRLLDRAHNLIERNESNRESGVKRGQDRDRVFYSAGSRLEGGVAFVFPGSGNEFADMGRELALQWPEILRRQDRENGFLASQMFAHRYWNTLELEKSATDHVAAICGQVALGSMCSDLAVQFGIKPDAVVGYSLGEATGLFALRAWTDRDEMLRRVSASTLFTSDLTGTSAQLHKTWQVPKGQRINWEAGLVDRAASVVREAIAKRSRIYILIVNTPNECVVGGDGAELRALIQELGCHWFPLEAISTVHCELLSPFADPYRELHLFKTSPPSGVKFFSGGWGRAYRLDQQTAADAIVAQASGCIDFPRVVRAAYDSGMRIFLEMGPGNSCTRMIGQILSECPHLACSLCASAQEPLLALLRVLGQLIAEGLPIDLGSLYNGVPEVIERQHSATDDAPRVRIPICGPSLCRPETFPAQSRFAIGDLAATSANAEAESVAVRGKAALDPFEAQVLQTMAETQTATLHAHQAYLNFSQGLAETLTRTVQSQMGSISTLSPNLTTAAQARPELEVGRHPNSPSGRPPKKLDRATCLEFARGSVATVLGPAFNEVDTFPTRVRLPDEPLMLVDRILEIHGEPGSLQTGRVVTQHDILPRVWYLDGGRIPTCIAVEAGQADLFLSGYLGIDFQTRGLAVYRLLDAKVCFHGGLPCPGSVIEYDIRIDRFFRQGNTWLFRFNFEATVNGKRFLTMTDGCAGFFSAAELADGRGIVRTAMDLQPMRGKRPVDWEDLVGTQIESYSEAQLDALRAGDLARCFGPQFAQLKLTNPLTLPAGRMKLVHRIAHLDPTGGRFGLALIRGEADIHPDDWFLTCHFVDDRVMPGTLMFECCLHTLRVFLLRMGWIAEQAEVALEPVPGVASQLKCRGQVLETTRVVTYEVSIKEIGFQPEPFAIADALMYADGKPIVEITNMSLRYAGLTREKLQGTWAATKAPPTVAARASSPGHGAKPAIYDYDRILAFAIGKPSEAFGAPYRVFDEKRRIARLPGPPYQFLDRITEVSGEPFRMAPGSSAEAQYDVPSGAWYFDENRQGDMPFAILLEIALQPCGWLAAYAGSALTSELDLSFRNLGGTGNQVAPVYRGTGTLTTRVKMTRVSSSAGMIIQGFDFEVRSAAGLIYSGDTYFGFFPQAALARQEGLKNAALYQPSLSELSASLSLLYPQDPPFPGRKLRMVDRIETFIPDGGPQQLGFIRATKQVAPEEWFFKAHFYQDPVVPGSLGLESFLQLLKFVALQRWGRTPGTRLEAVAIGQPHEWTYRGQIIPADKTVTIEAVVTSADDSARALIADGFLSIDGRVIYSLKNFSVREQRFEP